MLSVKTEGAMLTIQNKKGFTLIELMVVVAIIGILTAIAVPNFMNYQCKAKQSEAKGLLWGLRQTQEAYFAEYDTYTTNPAAAGFVTKGARYTITVDPADSTEFLATASTNNINGRTDTWTMNQEGELENTENACRN